MPSSFCQMFSDPATVVVAGHPDRPHPPTPDSDGLSDGPSPLPSDGVFATRPGLSHSVTLAAVTTITQPRAQMTRRHQHITQTLYGGGLRLPEAMPLRMKDLEFPQRQIVVRDAKGHDSRVTMLPVSLVEPLQEHLQGVKRLHHQDLEQGYGVPVLPFALARKSPNANRQWHWQFVFPASTRCQDPHRGAVVRYPWHESSLQKAVKRAVRCAGMQKRVGCHTFRHSFATHLLENGYDIPAVQE